MCIRDRAIIAGDGTVLAQTGMGEAGAAQLGQRLTAGESLSGQEQAHSVNNSWLVVCRTPYTPFFGAEERDLIASLSLQLRLALERAEMFTAHQEALNATQE